jgi:predicted dehydrogenase
MANPETGVRRWDVSRRDAIKAGVALTAAPGLLTLHAASDPVQFGMVGVGIYGTYLLAHLAQFDTGRCVALCDANQAAIDRAAQQVTTNPKKYKDYRDLLADPNVAAVVIAAPLHLHFQMTRDALLAGKHVYCENSLVFRADEVHALRALAADRGKQVLQVGHQRRYSSYFQAVKKMIDGGVLGTVTHIQAQWHRNPGWSMKAGGKGNPKNWRLFREY